MNNKKTKYLILILFFVPLAFFQNCSQLTSDVEKLNVSNLSSSESNQSGGSSNTNNGSTGVQIPQVTQSLEACVAAVPNLSITSTGSGFQKVEKIGSWNYQPMYPSQSACVANEGTVYEVGPNKKYLNPRDVPWLKLKGCDIVKIYYRTTPYTDIIYYTTRGEKNKWILIQGIPGSNGEKPIFDGQNAVMPTNTGVNGNVDSAGLFIVFKPEGVGRAGDYKPGYTQIDGFKFQHAKAPAQVTTMSGAKREWGSFSAGVYINGADFIAVTNNEFTDNGLGLFANSSDAGDSLQTRGLLIRGNYFHNNSNVGSFSEHNAYTEGIGTVYEYNYFGPILNGSYGDNVKERSSGIVFRYNYFEGGSNMISLRDPESNGAYEASQVDSWGERMVTAAFIYSNIFVAKNGMSFVIGHGDAFHGTGAQYREGNVYFFSNRVISRNDNDPFWFNNDYYEKSGIPVFVMSNTRSPATIVARNNMFDSRSYNKAADSALFALFYYQGKADFQSNWINTSFLNTYVNTKPADSMVAVGTLFNGAGLNLTPQLNVDPGFIDEANGNFLTKSTSPFASLKAALPDAVNKRCLMPASDPVVTH